MAKKSLEDRVEDLELKLEGISIWEHYIPTDCIRKVGSVGEPAECPNPQCSDPHGGSWRIVG